MLVNCCFLFWRGEGEISFAILRFFFEILFLKKGGAGACPQRAGKKTAAFRKLPESGRRLKLNAF
jgi:hypothetical protein